MPDGGTTRDITIRGLLIPAVLLSACAHAAGGWRQLPSLPDSEGFAGSFAGVSNGVLLVAGGANFPKGRPWEGGTKAWYDTVFALETPKGQWKVAGRLRRPMGYGVSVTHYDSLICVGGADAMRHYADACRLEWKDSRLVTTDLPPLPTPVANACGALVGDTLYVVGGIDKPDAVRTSKSTYQIDLAAPKPAWRQIEPCPGTGRMLAVAAAFDGAMWVAGGVDLIAGADGRTSRRYLSDSYRYKRGSGWTRVADLPHPVAAAPSPAPSDPSGFLILGNDDGSQIATSPDRHPGFDKTILRYDARFDRWRQEGQTPAPRVTTSCVPWNGSWVVPSGEARPGVRSPEVWSFTPTKE